MERVAACEQAHCAKRTSLVIVIHWYAVVCRGMVAPVATVEATRLWEETIRIPAALRATASDDAGVDDLARLLGAPDVRRIVATGNGAAYYAALALWLASLEGRGLVPEVVAVPAGLLASGFRWRDGDLPLVVSSSGELRDAIETLPGAGRRYGAITAQPGSSIGSGAAAVAHVQVESQDAVTHTQAFCGNVLVALRVWARLTHDDELADALAEAPDAVAATLGTIVTWAEATADAIPERPTAAIAFGSGPGWAAALECALLLKEIARIPAEGLETREGATSGMYALAPGQLAVSLPADGRDPLLDEAEATCGTTGATVVRLPGGEAGDRRLAAITTFPAAITLSIELGLRAGRDVDHPSWVEAYLATARIQTDGTEDA
jgi:glucosamine 6-phosphate synthetase-like amidotransferase/phosphosugar isomerase protein